MKMKWNLRVLMAQNDIASATELMRRLDAVGVQISTSHASRIVKEMPSRLSMDLLRGITDIFQCHANDLIIIEHDNEEVISKPAIKKTITTKSIQRKKKPVKESQSVISITGPSIRTFPIKGDD